MRNLKSFRSFSEERIKSIVLTFGRFQPPTIGHEKLINKIIELSKGADAYRIYSSQLTDQVKNPLVYADKMRFLRKMFPKAGRNIIEDKNIKTIFDVLDSIYAQGFTRIIVVVGSDRTEEFKRLLNKYDGVKQSNGSYYKFKDGIIIESSGDRDPDSDDATTGMTATKMRDAAKENNLDLFAKGLPRAFTGVAELFNAIRLGMNLKESVSVSPRNHIQLRTVSEKREQFVDGILFKCGDRVIISESQEEGVILSLGPNYVVVQVGDEVKRKWITAVERK